VIKKTSKAKSKGKPTAFRQNGKSVHLRGMPQDGGAWLERRLKALYESVLSEPLPDDMRKLIMPPK
jgi:hypothetical protein